MKKKKPCKSLKLIKSTLKLTIFFFNPVFLATAHFFSVSQGWIDILA